MQVLIDGTGDCHCLAIENKQFGQELCVFSYNPLSVETILICMFSSQSFFHQDFKCWIPSVFLSTLAISIIARTTYLNSSHIISIFRFHKGFHAAASPRKTLPLL